MGVLQETTSANYFTGIHSLYFLLKILYFNAVLRHYKAKLSYIQSTAICISHQENVVAFIFIV